MKKNKLLLIAMFCIFANNLISQEKQPPAKHKKTRISQTKHPQKPQRYFFGAILLPKGSLNIIPKVTVADIVPMATVNAVAAVPFVVKAPPVGNQMHMGSCVAWAVGYTFFSSYLQRNMPTTWSESNEISPSYIYNLLKAKNGDCINTGLTVPAVLDMLANIGACYIKSMPYVDSDCNSQPTLQDFAEADQFRSPYGRPDAFKDFLFHPLGRDPGWFNSEISFSLPSIPNPFPLPAPLQPGGPLNPVDPTHPGTPPWPINLLNPQVQLWKQIDANDVDLLKGSLVTFHWPVIVTLQVSQGFLDMWRKGHGIWTKDYQPNCSECGPHCVCIIGFDEARKMFKCQNQWGTAEGDHGYFWVSYDLVRNNCFQEAYMWVRDEHAH